MLKDSRWIALGFLLLAIAGQLVLETVSHETPQILGAHAIEQQYNGRGPSEKKARKEDSPAGLVTATVPNPGTTIDSEHRLRAATEHDQGGTEFLPVFLGIRVKITDSLLAGFTLALVIFTGLLWRSTDKLWRASQEQSTDMKRSIDEAAKSAASMKLVADSMEINARTVISMHSQQSKQMRAYISVDIGDAFYQDRVLNLRFTGRPQMVNNGFTPAHFVGYRAKAALLPVPLPADYTLPEPPKQRFGNSFIAPRGTVQFGQSVDEFCDDEDVIRIKRAEGRALYIWGTVTYMDVFRKTHFTNFCHIYTWLPDGNVWGYYTNEHNDADLDD